MNVKLTASKINTQAAITISGSKSETNRLLILQALYPNITLENVSDSDDSKVMIGALSSTDEIIDVHHAGSTMRFLTAYYSMQEGRTVTLTGSDRMKERPIKILVNALRQLGADIEYLENDGFPPIKIVGQKITKYQVSLDANVSSQYISALLLIAPKLENGLEIILNSEITSRPYLDMTIKLLDAIGAKTFFIGSKINVQPKLRIDDMNYSIESDWSSGSYYYSIVALAKVGTEITLSGFKENSLQGDSVVADIYRNFGVETVFQNNDSLVITKTNNPLPENFQLNLNHTPDLAQTIAVTCFGLRISCKLDGLHTLKIKETNRLEALKVELIKLGANVSIDESSITINSSNDIEAGISIKTYDDHRMAMAFAPLALKVPLVIENTEVVSKSYPGFWNDLESIGFSIDEIK